MEVSHITDTITNLTLKIQKFTPQGSVCSLVDETSLIFNMYTGNREVELVVEDIWLH